jgi:Tfp pilus assembly pilus retraction ATPase PilT
VPSLQGNLVLAQEILVINEALREPLRQGNVSELMYRVHHSSERDGMKTLNKALLQLFLRKKIDLKEAFLFSPDLDELDQMMSKLGG